MFMSRTMVIMLRIQTRTNLLLVSYYMNNEHMSAQYVRMW